MPGSVIVGGARTPIGKLSGGLKGFTAMDLGTVVQGAAHDRPDGRIHALRVAPAGEHGKGDAHGYFFLGM